VSERDDAARDTDADAQAESAAAPARRRWVKWVWPVTTFVLISAFMFAAMFVRDLGPAPAPTAAGPEPAQHLNTRAWRTIAADPEAYADERVVLWGQVTAFAQASDPSTFRANVDAARHQPKGGQVDYPTAVVLRGDPQQLSSLAPGYIFKAEVTVDGAAPPGAAAPGGAVTPRLTVTRLTVTDRTVG
jgi:hypothetical protein